MSDLTPGHRKIVQRQLKQGGYSSASEVIGEALRLLELRNRVRDEELRDFYASIRRGREDLRNGRFIPIDDLTPAKVRSLAGSRTNRRARKSA